MHWSAVLLGLPGDYRMPFEDEVGLHPTLEEMQDVVVSSRKRPQFKPHWLKNEVVHLCTLFHVLLLMLFHMFTFRVLTQCGMLRNFAAFDVPNIVSKCRFCRILKHSPALIGSWKIIHGVLQSSGKVLDFLVSKRVGT